MVSPESFLDKDSQSTTIYSRHTYTQGRGNMKIPFSLNHTGLTHLSSKIKNKRRCY